MAIPLSYSLYTGNTDEERLTNKEGLDFFRAASKVLSNSSFKNENSKFIATDSGLREIICSTKSFTSSSVNSSKVEPSAAIRPPVSRHRFRGTGGGIGANSRS